MNYKLFLFESLLCLCTMGGINYLTAEEAYPLSKDEHINIPEVLTRSIHKKKPCPRVVRKYKNKMNQLEQQVLNAWLTIGNSNIDPHKNFLGTFDATPINISANGLPGDLPYIGVTARGQIEIFNTHQGVFLGEGSGASNQSANNTFIGYHSGFNTSIEPIFQQPGDNTALGNNSLFSNTIGQDNTAIGSSALFSAVEASQNTAVGFQALFASLDGAFNTAVGASSLNSGTTGSFNTAVGFSALHNNAQNFNTAIGFQCMGGNATGRLNTAVGNNALLNNIGGNLNTAIGISALISNDIGSQNTAIGANADVSLFAGPLTNATAIGFGAVCDASNKVRIGNMEVDTIEGQVEFTTPSDGRFKINVQNNVPGLSFIMNLRPVTYQVDRDRMAALMQIPDDKRLKVREVKQSKIIKSGFIAQEVEVAAQKCGYDFDGLNTPEDEDKGYYGLAYSSFVISLVKAVQEQQSLILDLQQNVQQLNETVQQQQMTIQKLQR